MQVPWGVPVAIGLASMALMLVPGGAAQGLEEPTLELAVASVPDGPLAINGAPQPIQVDYTYTLAPHAHAFTLLQSSATLRFDPAPACAASGFVVTGPTGITIPLRSQGMAGAPQSTHEGNVTFYVTATHDAPGQASVPCAVQGYVEPVSAQVGQTQPATASMALQAAYVGWLGLSRTEPVLEVRPGEVASFGLEVTNGGNALTLVETVVELVPPGWEVTSPAPVTLGSRSQDKDPATGILPFVAKAPAVTGWTSETAMFRLRLTPVSALDGTPGQSQTVLLSAWVRGWHCPTEGSCNEAARDLVARCDEAWCRAEIERSLADCGDPGCPDALQAVRSPSPGAGVALMAVLGLAAALRRKA